FFFSSRRRHTRFSRDWSSDVCSSDLQFLDQQLKVSLLCPSCARERYFLTLCLCIFQQTARLGTTTDRRTFVASTEEHSCLDVTHKFLLFDVFLYEPPATVRCVGLILHHVTSNLDAPTSNSRVVVVAGRQVGTESTRTSRAFAEA